jgi:hypothetical protein
VIVRVTLFLLRKSLMSASSSSPRKVICRLNTLTLKVAAHAVFGTPVRTKLASATRKDRSRFVLTIAPLFGRDIK